ncbi:MAG: hydrogen gas-evolving membrane-bound hydrogenase subunit E [Haloarculaceae archaeon]
MEPEQGVVLAAIALPFLGAVLTPLAYRLFALGGARLRDEGVGYAGALVALASFGLVASQVGRDGTVTVPWIPSLDVAIRLRVDGLALLFALLASGIGVCIFVYAARYMRGKPNLGRFFMTLLAFMGSILGVAFAADLVVLFLFWELTSVCSFVLIGYYTDDDESRYSARMAMLVTVGGGLCLLVGALLLSVAAGGLFDSGAFDIAAMLANEETMRAALEESGLFLPALALITVAAGAKSAQVPLHFWLPRAMVAPTPVSAFLHSATMVKVGVYVLGRLRPLFHGPEWTAILVTLGLVTMTVGAVLAVLSTDIKELLAYSTASHLGLMVAGFGLQSHYGAETGAYHLFNHALFKAALFLVAGIVAHEVGTRAIDDLGGLWRDLPVTAAIAGVTALSMAGVPPFGGFYSKELLFAGTWDAATTAGGFAWLFPTLAVFASIFTVVYSLRFIWLFVGDQPDTATVDHRPSPALVVPAAVLAILVAVTSVAPELAIDAIVQDAAEATAVGSVEVHAELPTHITPPAVMSAIALVVGTAGFTALERVRTAIEWVHTRAGVVHPTALYDRALSAVETASAWLGPAVHTGQIRTYVTWGLATACTLALAGYVSTSVALPSIQIDASIAMVLVLATAVVAAVAVTRAEAHVTGVLTLGILGLMVAIFYILASGPDLALTQLIVETLLLLIFLLVIEQMPAYYGELETAVAVRDAAFSVFVGATATVTVLLAVPPADQELSETARFYVDAAVPEGGGSNIVNVILTDFRAFDTLGESVVVLIAALSVLVLLAMRSRGETR